MPLPVSRRLRHVLLRALELFVSPVGSDNNDGLHPSRPFKTVQAAVDKAVRLDTATYGIDIILAPGTYAGNVALGQYPGAELITIRSESFDERDTTIISGTVDAYDCGHWEFRHVTISGLLRIRESHISLRGTNHLINSNRDYCIDSAFHSTVTVEDNSAWDTSDLYLTYSSGTVKSWLSIRAHGSADLTGRTVECIYSSAPTWTEGGVWMRTSGTLEALGVTTVNDNLLGYEIKAEGGSAAFIADDDDLPGQGRVSDNTSTVGTGGQSGAADTGRLLLYGHDGIGTATPPTPPPAPVSIAGVFLNAGTNPVGVSAEPIVIGEIADDTYAGAYNASNRTAPISVFIVVNTAFGSSISDISATNATWSGLANDLAPYPIAIPAPASHTLPNNWYEMFELSGTGSTLVEIEMTVNSVPITFELTIILP